MTEKEVKDKIKWLSIKNGDKYNFLKASEELQELSLALIQRVTKPASNNLDDIILEYADVTLRLEVALESLRTLDPNVEEKIYMKLIDKLEYLKDASLKDSALLNLQSLQNGESAKDDSSGSN